MATVKRLWLGLLVAVLTDSGTATAQQVLVIELPPAVRLGPETAVVKKTAVEQRKYFLERASRIRSHHRPIPLKGPTSPFSTMLSTTKTRISPRSLEAQMQNEMNIIRQTSVTRAAGIDYRYASPISEPTVASRGDEVLVTGNWYSAMSLDGGVTFRYIDPTTMFERAGTKDAFCCDQVALYDRDTDAMFWLMQGAVDSEFKGNQLLLLVAQGKDDIRNNNWFYINFPSTKILRREGRWFDFPDVAVSDKYLYITTNYFTTADDKWDGSVVMRFDKRQLASYKASQAQVVGLRTGSLRLSQGAKQTMYWAGHDGQSTSLVWSWGDDRPAPEGPLAIEVETWEVPSAESTKTAKAPNGRPWLTRADGRITAAWTAKGHVGFGWTAGADNRFNFPHVRVAVISESDIATTGIGSISPKAQPHIWNTTFGIAYPSAAPNQAGAVGISVAYGGPRNYPGYAIGFFPDGFARPPNLTRVREGRNAPMCPRIEGIDRTCGVWGDFYALRPHGTAVDSWVTVGYTVQNQDTEDVKVESEFIWFDRRR